MAAAYGIVFVAVMVIGATVSIMIHAMHLMLIRRGKRLSGHAIDRHDSIGERRQNKQDATNNSHTTSLRQIEARTRYHTATGSVILSRQSAPARI